MRYEIRELDIGGILDQAIKLSKDHFWLFLKISAVLLLPFAIITGLVTLSQMPDVPTVAEPRMFTPSAQNGLPPGLLTTIAISGLINLLLIIPLTDAALVYAIASCYLDKPIGVSAAFSRALRILFPLIGTWILMGLAIGAPIIVAMIAGVVVGPAGFLLMIPCAIISLVCAYWFMLSSKVVVIEGTAGTRALNRSKNLIKGNFGTVFALGIVVGIISWMVNWSPKLIPQAELRVVVAAILQAVLSFFAAAAWVVFYFSCRCKHENFDLTVLADSVAAEDAPAAE